jgi:hypothetical protein
MDDSTTDLLASFGLAKPVKRRPPVRKKPAPSQSVVLDALDSLMKEKKSDSDDMAPKSSMRHADSVIELETKQAGAATVLFGMADVDPSLAAKKDLPSMVETKLESKHAESEPKKESRSAVRHDKLREGLKSAADLIGKHAVTSVVGKTLMTPAPPSPSTPEQVRQAQKAKVRKEIALANKLLHPTTSYHSRIWAASVAAPKHKPADIQDGTAAKADTVAKVKQQVDSSQAAKGLVSKAATSSHKKAPAKMVALHVFSDDAKKWVEKQKNEEKEAMDDSTTDLLASFGLAKPVKKRAAPSHSIVMDALDSLMKEKKSDRDDVEGMLHSKHEVKSSAKDALTPLGVKNTQHTHKASTSTTPKKRATVTASFSHDPSNPNKDAKHVNKKMLKEMANQVKQVTSRETKAKKFSPQQIKDSSTTAKTADSAHDAERGADAVAKLAVGAEQSGKHQADGMVARMKEKIALPPKAAAVSKGKAPQAAFTHTEGARKASASQDPKVSKAAKSDRKAPVKMMALHVFSEDTKKGETKAMDGATTNLLAGFGLANPAKKRAAPSQSIVMDALDSLMTEQKSDSDDVATKSSMQHTDSVTEDEPVQSGQHMGTKRQSTNLARESSPQATIPLPSTQSVEAQRANEQVKIKAQTSQSKLQTKGNALISSLMKAGMVDEASKLKAAIAARFEAN